jgi:hypothetical protein
MLEETEEMPIDRRSVGSFLEVVKTYPLRE